MACSSLSPSGHAGPERRACPRIPAAAVPFLTARVAGGPPVRLVDLSKRGVKVESTLPLPTGSRVTLRFLAGDASLTLTSAVVRSTLAVESRGEVTYHSALAFTDELTLCGEELSAAAGATSDATPPEPARSEAASDYTMIVMDGRTGLHEHAEAARAC